VEEAEDCCGEDEVFGESDGLGGVFLTAAWKPVSTSKGGFHAWLVKRKEVERTYKVEVPRRTLLLIHATIFVMASKRPIDFQFSVSGPNVSNGSLQLVFDHVSESEDLTSQSSLNYV
jgi:hypothetical protein